MRAAGWEPVSPYWLSDQVARRHVACGAERETTPNRVRRLEGTVEMCWGRIEGHRHRTTRAPMTS